MIKEVDGYEIYAMTVSEAEDFAFEHNRLLRIEEAAKEQDNAFVVYAIFHDAHLNGETSYNVYEKYYNAWEASIANLQHALEGDV